MRSASGTVRTRQIADQAPGTDFPIIRIDRMKKNKDLGRSIAQPLLTQNRLHAIFAGSVVM